MYLRNENLIYRFPNTHLTHNHTYMHLLNAITDGSIVANA